MDSNNVVFICQPRPHIFTLDEANSLVPILNKLSMKYDGIITKALADQRHNIKSGASKVKIDSFDDIVAGAMVTWGQKAMKLGAKVMEGGYLGFDSGQGYYSFHYGESCVEYVHGYDERPYSRKQIPKELSGNK